MRSKIIVQLILLITSFVIIFTYIKPAYGELQDIKIQTDRYVEALENAETFNTELQRLLTKADQFTVSQLNALDRFLPSEIDTVAVMRDIEIITRRNNMKLTGLSAGDESVENSGSSESVEYYDNQSIEYAQGQSNPEVLKISTVTFELDTQGTYEAFKKLLQDIERNAYLLEIVSLTVTPGSLDGSDVALSSGLYSFNIKMEVYKLADE